MSLPPCAQDSVPGGLAGPLPGRALHPLEAPGSAWRTKAVEEFRIYIQNNTHLIPNYGERYRHGEVITTSFVESTVNQVVSKRFCKRQQMQWSKRGAHLLLQARVKTLDREWASVFRRWYPDMEVEAWEDAA